MRYKITSIFFYKESQYTVTTKIVGTIKSITTIEVFSQAPEVKRAFWGGSFWGSGLYINTVLRHSSEKRIAQYVKNQGILSIG